MRVVAFDVGQQAEIISGLQAIQMRFQVSDQTGTAADGLLQRVGILGVGEKFDAIAFKERRLGGKRAGLFVLVGQLAGLDLAGFDVRLVEGVYADDRAGDRNRNLPAEELLAQIVFIGDGNAHHRLSGLFQRVDIRVQLGVGAAVKAHVDEDSIVAIYTGRANRFAVHRNQAFAFFSGRFGDELLEPGAEIGNSGRSEQSYFVAAQSLSGAENRAQDRARIFVRGDGCAAAHDHFFGAFEKFGDAHALNRGGNHAEIRKRGIAAADAGHAVENIAEVVGLSDFLHVRAGIGGGDEALSGFGGTDRFGDQIVEKLLEDIGLKRAAGFAGHDEDRLVDVDILFDGADLRRIGRIQHVHLRTPRLVPVGLGENFDAQAGTAHAQQDAMGESSFLDVRGDFFQFVVLGDLFGDNGEPAKPFAFVGVGPKRSVFGPQTFHFVVFLPVFDVRGYGLGKLVRQLVSERIHYFFTADAALVCWATAASKVSKAEENCFTPSSVSLSVAAFIEIPAFSSPCMLWCAASTFSSRLLRGLPWSRNAS